MLMKNRLLTTLLLVPLAVTHAADAPEKASAPAGELLLLINKSP
jgi:hypothetical protein